MRAISKCVMAAAIALLVNAPAAAHVPTACGELYIDAAHKSDLTIQRGQAVNALVQSTLEKLPQADRDQLIEHYADLADAIGEVFSQQIAMFVALATMVECTE